LSAQGHDADSKESLTRRPYICQPRNGVTKKIIPKRLATVKPKIQTQLQQAGFETWAWRNSPPPGLQTTEDHPRRLALNRKKRQGHQSHTTSISHQYIHILELASLKKKLHQRYFRCVTYRTGLHWQQNNTVDSPKPPLESIHKDCMGFLSGYNCTYARPNSLLSR
jgi:hypothetical protein